MFKFTFIREIKFIKSIKREEIGGENEQIKSERNFFAFKGVNLLKYTNLAVFLRTSHMIGH